MIKVDYKMTDEDFMMRPAPEQNLVLFKMLANSQITDKVLSDKINEQYSSCNQRFCKIERRKWFDKGIAAFSGGITGILTALGFNIGR